MNVELVSAESLSEASSLIANGGDDIVLGIAKLLEAKDDYIKRNGKNGKNCSQVLNAALKKLGEDPYLTLGVAMDGTKEAIKKSYRKKALKYHPDKNPSTPMLFTVIQAAYDILSDAEKKSTFDTKRKRQEAALSELRKRQPPPPQSRPVSAKSSAAGNGGPQTAPASTTKQDKNFTKKNEFEPKPTPTPDKEFSADREARQREFNKSFFREYREAARKGTFGPDGSHIPTAGCPPPSSGAPPTSGRRPPCTPRSYVPENAIPGNKSNGVTPTAPKKPKTLRVVSRGDTHVTLEWVCDGTNSSTAFELQWRKRVGKAHDWITADTLILGTMARKKNLEPSSCYEFRIRAATAWGWSAYSDPLIVVTAAAEFVGSSAGTADKQAFFQAPRKYSYSAFSPSGKDIPEGRVESNAQKKNSFSSKMRRKSQDCNEKRTWICMVCKRENNSETSTCGVCYTQKSYQADKLHNIKESTLPRYHPRTRPASAAHSRRSPMTQDPVGGGEEGGCPQTMFPNVETQSEGAGMPQPYVHTASPEVKLPSPNVKQGCQSTEKSECFPSDKRGYGRGHRLNTIPSIRVFGASFVVDGSGGGAQKASEKPGTFDDIESEEDLGETWKVENEADVFSETQNLKHQAESLRRNSEFSSQSFYTQGTVNDNDFSDVDGFNTDRAQTEPLPKEAQNGPSKKRVFKLLDTGVNFYLVRAEPICDSTVVGRIGAAKKVVAIAQAGEWLKVRYHEPVDGQLPKGYGWCMYKDIGTGAKYLKELRRRRQAPTSEDSDSQSELQKRGNTNWWARNGESSDYESDAVVCKWYELRNDEGILYYFNSETGESQWEPPLWMSEVDPSSGVTYYTNSLTGEAQWEKPEGFVPVVREEAYSTPASDFAKFVLSPTKPRRTFL